jgi:hypothetical protein
MKSDRAWRLPTSGLAAALTCMLSTCSCQADTSPAKADIATAKSIEGVWVIETGVVGVELCPPIVDNPQPIFSFPSPFLSIAANGMMVTALGGGCVAEFDFRADQPWGVGTLDAGVLTLRSNRQVFCTADCTLQISDTEIMSVHDAELEGAQSGLVEGTSGCGTGFPRQIQGPVTWQRCSSPCGSTCVPFVRRY